MPLQRIELRLQPCLAEKLNRPVELVHELLLGLPRLLKTHLEFRRPELLKRLGHLIHDALEVLIHQLSHQLVQLLDFLHHIIGDQRVLRQRLLRLGHRLLDCLGALLEPRLGLLQHPLGDDL